MARYHVNPRTGNTGLCKAQAGKCPFGGEEAHFSSRSRAAEAYEAAMAGGELEGKHRGQEVLSRLARSGRSEADLAPVLEQGSPRTLKMLARNAHVPAKVLEAAAAKLASTDRAPLVRHEHFPVRAMTNDEYASVVWKSGWERRGALLRSEAVTDEKLRSALNAAPKGERLNYYEALAAPNQLSQAYIVELTETNWMSFERGIVSARYPAEERLPHLPLSLVRPALRKITDDTLLTAITARAVEENDATTLGQLALHGSMTADNLHSIVQATDDVDTLMAAYRNGNSTDDVRFAAMKHGTVQAYHRLERLDSELDGGLGFEIGAGEEEILRFDSQERVVQFDKHAVDELGLSDLDIDTYVRYYRGNYLFGTSYDRRHGVYKGYTS